MKRGLVIFLAAILPVAAFAETRTADNVKGGHNSVHTFENKDGLLFWLVGNAASNWKFISAEITFAGNPTFWTATHSPTTTRAIGIALPIPGFTAMELFSVALEGDIVPIEGQGQPPPTDYRIKGRMEGDYRVEPDTESIIAGENVVFKSFEGKDTPVDSTWKIETKKPAGIKAPKFKGNGKPSIDVGPCDSGGIFQIVGTKKGDTSQKDDAELKVYKVQFDREGVNMLWKAGDKYELAAKHLLPDCYDVKRFKWTILAGGGYIDLDQKGVVTFTKDSESGVFTQVEAASLDKPNAKDTFYIASFIVDCKIRHYDGRTEKWDDNIDAVVGDKISFRNHDGEKQPPMICRWDFAGERKNVFGEKTTHSFIATTSSDTEREVKLEGLVNKRIIGEDQGVVKLHEAWVVSLKHVDIFHSKASGVLPKQYITENIVNSTSPLELVEQLPYHNIYIYSGSGIGWKDLEFFRKKNKTPENKERKYRFVMIHACRTGSNKYRTALKATTYIGYTNRPKPIHAEEYDEIFWRCVSKYKLSCGEAHNVARSVTDPLWKPIYKEQGKPFPKPLLFGNRSLKLIQ